MKPKQDYDDDSYLWGPGLMQGSAHSISQDDVQEDAAEKVRKVAEEVSRKTFSRPVKKIGFY